MSCSCRKYTAWLSRSENRATSTLAPVTSSRPEDCTWIAARCTTRWKPAVGFGIARPVGGQAGQVLVEELLQIAPQLVQIHAAGPQHGRRIRIVGKAEQQVLQGGVFVTALAGEGQGAVQRLF